MADNWYYLEELERLQRPKKVDVLSEYVANIQIGKYNVLVELDTVRRGSAFEIIGYLYSPELKAAILIDTAPSYKTYVLPKKKLIVIWIVPY